MSVDVDTDMDNIVGTKDGRVFMTGIEDGNLYELHYQVEEGWFTKKIRLNNLTIGALQNILPSVFGYKQTGKLDMRGSCTCTETFPRQNRLPCGRRRAKLSLHLHTLQFCPLPLLPWPLWIRAAQPTRTYYLPLSGRLKPPPSRTIYTQIRS